MKTKFITLFVLIGLFLGSSVFAQTTFKNPILTGMNPDPSICRVGDDFYLITSTFEYFPGLPIYHSKDLAHWKMIGYVLSKASNNPLIGCESATGGQYAPTLRYNNGTFYVTCTNYGGQGSQGAFYVTAKDPAGPWSNPIWVNNWYVDPSPMFANDSMYYLTPDNAGSFMIGTMNPATGKYYTPLRKIAAGLGGSSPEGPHSYKINDYYYLMSAEGGTGYQHKEVIQRSKSPYGPYEASPVNPVVSHENVPNNPFQAIGHADLVQLPDNSWWLVCLGFRPVGGNYHHLGRETFLAPVTWSADGWPKVGTDGIVKEEYPVPNLPEHIWEKEPVRDDFDSITLRLPWNFIRNPHAANWSLTEKPGYLRLNGSKISFREKDSPAFIGRRQSAFNLVASTKIGFIPTAENEEAGLVVRGDDKNHFDLLVTLFAGKRVVMFREYLQDKVLRLNYREIPDGDITLRISATDLEYKFWLQTEGKTAELIGTATTKDLSTEKIGGFTGTYIGMYASGNGKVNTNPADFDWFDFEEEPALPYSWSLGAKDVRNRMVAPVIVSTSSASYDQAKIGWNNIENETSYIIERYADGKFDSISSTQADDTIFIDNGLTGNTMYIYRIVAKNESGYSNASIAVSVVTLPKPGAYFGTPAPIPGKIETENYDWGEKDEAYFDTDNVNNGGKYRNEGVDVQSCWDTNNGYEIGWIEGGEWLAYTVDVNDSIVDIQLRLASNSGGSIKFELDGKEIAKTDIVVTGGWSTYKTVTLSNVKLDTGKNKKMKVIFASGGFNFNWMNFVKVKPTTVTVVRENGISVYPNPAFDMLTVKCESFKYSTIEIFNMEGKCMLSELASNQTENNIQFSLPAGQYVLSLNNASQKKTVKFSVIR